MPADDAAREAATIEEVRRRFEERSLLLCGEQFLAAKDEEAFMAGDLDGQAEEIAELYYEHAVGTLGAEDLTGFSLAILGSAMRMSSSLASFVATGSEENVPGTKF